MGAKANMTTINSEEGKDGGKGCWRYQVVYTINEYNKEREYSLCEVYLDENEKLEMWTENHAMRPYGDNEKELIEDLKIMLSDAKKWEAVPFQSLETGMTFRKNT